MWSIASRFWLSAYVDKDNKQTVEAIKDNWLVNTPLHNESVVWQLVVLCVAHDAHKRPESSGLTSILADLTNSISIKPLKLEVRPNLNLK